MLPLPLLNVLLQPCSEEWQQMTPTAQGRHCASCQRTVFDFTDKTQADLEAARAAAPDGRLCGRFRAEQLAPPPRLRPKLRQFLVALVLVCGLGLTSGEAWAQVRKVGHHCNRCSDSEPQLKTADEFNPLALATDMEPVLAPVGALPEAQPLLLGIVSEIMPVYKNGGSEGLIKFIRENLKYPVSSMPSGKVFLSFVVSKTGKVTDLHIQRGLEPAADSEALRVMRLMGPWKPGEQQGRPIDVSYTLPITFRRN